MNLGNEQKRADGRSDNQLRPIRIIAGVNSNAEGSAEVTLGETKVFITASVDKITNENSDQAGQIYVSLSMLPRAMTLKISDTSIAEIVQQELSVLQQIIARSLRCAISSSQMQNISITLDCVIIRSDSGIASATIAGAWTALYQALRWAAKEKLLSDNLYVIRIAGISASVYKDRFFIDPCTEEASESDFTLNLVFDENIKLVDIRGNKEKEPLDMSLYLAVLNATSKQVSVILQEQERAVLEAESVKG